ncbi:MAG TPA: MaoC/PaaZ C-terminal domain-containing protein [Acidimicrobiales bacterium]
MADHRFPVEAGHVMAFARAVGEPNPVHTDVRYARSQGFPDVLAPPTFYEASAHFDPENTCRPHVGQPWWGSSGVPTGDPGREDRNPGTTLHAETHVTYHRHPCAGEVLHARERPGERWTRVGRRGGELVFNDWYVDYRDAAGEVALTARTVAVTTAQKLPAPERGSAGTVDVPAGAVDLSEPVWTGPASPGDVAVGQTRTAVLARDLRRVQIIQYAGASGDFSPQHTDEVYNTQVAGYPTVFAHGMLTMAMTARLLTGWFGDARLRTYGLRFQGLVWPGDTLVATAAVTAIDRAAQTATLDVHTTSSTSPTPVVSGYATVALDGPIGRRSDA